MKIKSLLEQYEFSLKCLTVSMPIAAAIFVIAGIVTLIKYINSMSWFCLIFFGLAAMVIVEYFVIRRYMLKKIAQLKEEENPQPQDDQQ